MNRSSPLGSQIKSFLAKRQQFFREGSWMVLATTLSGGMMFLVHAPVSRMPPEEYAVFGTLLQALVQLGIPAVGLQGLFAQLFASAVTPQDLALARHAVRSVSRGLSLLWVTIAFPLLIWQEPLSALLKIQDPTALWLTLLGGWLALMLPIFLGILQGVQLFSWLGGATLIQGFVRLGSVIVIVLWWKGESVGALAGIILSIAAGTCVAVWFSRPFLDGPSEGFLWRPWIARVLPLTIGLGVPVFMMSFDMIIAQSLFPSQETAPYTAAGTLARGLYFFTVPLTAVMFPKVVRSAAKSEKSDVMFLVLLLTALVGGAVCLGFTLFPSLPFRLVYPVEYAPGVQLLPLFAWCMLPQMLAVVLIQNLMARQRYEGVMVFLLIAISYVTTLSLRHDSLREIIWVLGIHNCMLMIAAMGFTARTAKRSETHRSKIAC